MIGGLYLERRSWLHRVPAAAKLVALAVATPVLFSVSDPRGLLPLAAGCIGVYLSLGRVGPAGRRPIVASLAAGLLLCAFHAWLGQPWLGAASALRLLAATSLGTSLTLSTRFNELLDVFERVLRPLQRLGVAPGRLALMLALMVRFTEHFFVQWQALDEAHRLRTGRAGGLKILPPLCIQMLQAADRVADTLQLRLGR